jgi:hypothetical protein
MKAKPHFALVVLLLSTLHLQLSTARAQSTAFTYQGRLADNGAPAGGIYDLRFTIYGLAAGGNAVGVTLTNSAVGVSNGLFTVALDFGANFPGAERWLEIAARTNGLGAFVVLNPRQLLAPTPYAITAGNLTGPLPAAQLSGPVASANLAGAYSSALTLDNAANNFSGSGAGLTGLNANQLTSGTAPDARLAANVARTNQVWLLGGNADTTPGTHFLGTTDNQPLEIKVNGMRALWLEDGRANLPANHFVSSMVNIVLGSSANFVGDVAVYTSTVGGGGSGTFSGPNRVESEVGTVSGGEGNTILKSSRGSNIGGGRFNTIGITNGSPQFGAIGGGRYNTIDSYHSTIAGGLDNTVQPGSERATIGGGRLNRIEEAYATIPGGFQNTAAHEYTFAAGRRAMANHVAAFVWADSSMDLAFASTAPNQFLIRAIGGVGIGTTAPQRPLHVAGTNGQLRLHNTTFDHHWDIYTEAHTNNPAASGNLLFRPGPGGVVAFIRKSDGNYFSGSDARLKQDIRDMNPVLDRVLRLRPVSYRFKSAPESALPTLGLIAQEVEPLFPEVVDEHDGMKALAYAQLIPVTIGAIQEFNQKMGEKMEQQGTEIRELKRAMNELKERIGKLTRKWEGDTQ